MKFAIVGMPRTGSSLLLTGIQQHPSVRVHGELFHSDVKERAVTHRVVRGNAAFYYPGGEADPMDFLRDEVFAEPTGEAEAAGGDEAVGFKVFGEIVQCPGTTKFFVRLKEEFPELRVIHIIRENSLDVLVSRMLAEQTGEWARLRSADGSASEAPRSERVHIPPTRAREGFEALARMERFFSTHFEHDRYASVTYEALSNDYEGAVNGCFEFLGLERLDVRPVLSKQNTRAKVDTVSNYAELKIAFAATPFERFFDE